MKSSLVIIAKTGLPLIAASLLLLTGITLAANGYAITPHVIGGGGGHSEAAPYTLDGTVGQAVAGEAILAGPYDQCAGFWCWAWSFERAQVFLPIVLRNSP